MSDKKIVQVIAKCMYYPNEHGAKIYFMLKQEKNQL